MATARRSAVAEQLLAFYPEEFIAAYKTGRRDFRGINLLRKEFEETYPEDHHFDCADHPEAGNPLSPLRLDCALGAGSMDFEWNSGRIVDVPVDDAPEDRDLSGADLRDVVLEGAYLYPVNFSHANFNSANLKRAVFLNCDFSHADLTRADLRDARFDRCNFIGANLYMARMDRCQIVDSPAIGANLHRAKLKKALLIRVDLTSADLRSHFDRTALDGSALCEIDLDAVRLRDVYVYGIQITASQAPGLLEALGVVVVDES